MMHHDGVGGLSLAAHLAFRYLAFEGIAPHWATSAGEAYSVVVAVRPLPSRDERVTS